MVIKVNFVMTWTLKMIICVLFLVVNYVVVHIKLNPPPHDQFIVKYSNLSTFVIIFVQVQGSYFVQIVNYACTLVSTNASMFQS